MSTQPHYDHQTKDRPRYPKIEDEYDEDPARFLSDSEHYLPVARIRGIRDPGLLSAYRAVERREFGGRSRILEAIDERERELRNMDTPDPVADRGGD